MSWSAVWASLRMQSSWGFYKKMCMLNKAKLGVFSILPVGSSSENFLDVVWEGVGSSALKQRLKTAKQLRCEDDCRICSQVQFQSSSIYSFIRGHCPDPFNKNVGNQHRSIQGKCSYWIYTNTKIRDTEFEDSSLNKTVLLNDQFLLAYSISEENGLKIWHNYLNYLSETSRNKGKHTTLF